MLAAVAMQASPPRPVFPALAASVVLHGLLLAWLTHTASIRPTLPAPAEARLMISLVKSSRQPEAATAADAPDVISAVASVAQGSLDGEVSPQQAAASTAVPPPATSVVVSSVPRASAVEEAENAITAGVTLPEASLKSAIQSFVQSLRSEQTAAWTGACMRRQREQLRDDCPDQPALQQDMRNEDRRMAARVFAPATRDDRHARLRADLQEQYQAMDELQEQGGLIGELAATRKGMTRENLAYLSGNLNSPAMAFVQVSQRDNPNLPFMLGNMLQFMCAEQPCVYEWTGFEAVNPQPEPVPPAPESAGDQALQPWVSRRRLWPAGSP